jgi:nitroreductase
MLLSSQKKTEKKRRPRGKTRMRRDVVKARNWRKKENSKRKKKGERERRSNGKEVLCDCAGRNLLYAVISVGIGSIFISYPYADAAVLPPLHRTRSLLLRPLPADALQPSGRLSHCPSADPQPIATHTHKSLLIRSITYNRSFTHCPFRRYRK